MNHRLTIGLAFVVVAAMAVPTTLATHGGAHGLFGKQITAIDGDFVNTLDALTSLDTICFVDEDASGSFSAGEVAYLIDAATEGDCATTDTVGVNAVRLTAFESQVPGSQVRSTHTDQGVAVSTVTGLFGYYDADNDDKYSLGDNVYIHWGAITSGTTTVTNGDVRVTGFASFAVGSTVAAADADATGKVLSTDEDDVNGAGDDLDNDAADRDWAFADVDGNNLFGIDEPVFIDLRGPGEVTLGDVRLGSSNFGMQVLAADGDHVWELTDMPDGSAAGVLGLDAVCFVDEDSSGSFNSGETAYLIDTNDNDETCDSETVNVNAVRLSAFETQAAGSQVRSTHTDQGVTVATVEGVIAYYDADNDDVFSFGDNLYVHWAAVTSGTTTVSNGDLRLTGFASFAPGTTVAAADSDATGKVLSTDRDDLDGAGDDFDFSDWAFWDADGNGIFGIDEDVLVDADSNLFLSLIDVNLGTTSFGTQVPETDARLVYVLTDMPDGSAAGVLGLDAVCFVDEDSSGSFGPGETAYLIDTNDNDETCDSETVNVNAVRLSAFESQVAGSQVRSTHTDQGVSVATVEGEIAYYDADNDDKYSAGDPIYIHWAAVTSGTTTVSNGDLRLTGFSTFGAGTVVAAADSDATGKTLSVDKDDYDGDDSTVASDFDVGDWVFWDADGNGLFGIDETVYIDVDDDGSLLASLADVRLGDVGPKAVGTTPGPTTPGPTTPGPTTPGPTTPGPTTPGPTTPGPTTPGPTTPGPTTPPTTPPKSDDSGEKKDEGAPGLGLVGVLAALGVALVLLRRRQ